MNNELIKEDEKDSHGMVMYCDGSAMPSTGHIGMGFHGYVFKMDQPKRGSGNPLSIPTMTGYVPKKDHKEDTPEVTPVVYFDGYSSTNIRASNNVAELLAANSAVEIAKDYPIKKLLIKTDSEYVRKGVQKWIPHWVRNQSIGYSGGEPVANAEHWENLMKNISILRQKGVEFDIKWVKGHADVQGNVKADYLAKIGRINSETHFTIMPYNGIEPAHKTQVIKNQAEGYWKTKSDRHPMLCFTWFYFNSLKDSHVSGEYYQSTVGDDEDYPGKPNSETAYSVVQLAKPIDVMEMLRTFQSEVTGSYDSIIAAHMDNLFGNNRQEDFMNYGNCTMMRRSPRKADLSFIDGTPITFEKRPQLKAMEVVEGLSTLKAILLNYKEEKMDGYIVTDVTNSFYTQTVKSTKKSTEAQTKLLDKFGVGSKSLQIEVNYNGGTKPVTFNFGLDIPDRNALKRLETTNPVVKVIAWHESAKSFRYAVVIHNEQGDFGIWAAYYSNLVFVS
jgi:ribonuclease HI